MLALSKATVRLFNLSGPRDGTLRIVRAVDWEGLIATYLDVPPATWDSLKDTSRFPTRKPTEPKPLPLPAQPTLQKFIPSPPPTPANAPRQNVWTGRLVGWLLLLLLVYVAYDQLTTPSPTLPNFYVFLFGLVTLAFLNWGYTQNPRFHALPKCRVQGRCQFGRTTPVIAISHFDSGKQKRDVQIASLKHPRNELAEPNAQVSTFPYYRSPVMLICAASAAISIDQWLC